MRLAYNFAKCTNMILKRIFSQKIFVDINKQNLMLVSNREERLQKIGTKKVTTCNIKVKEFCCFSSFSTVCFFVPILNCSEEKNLLGHTIFLALFAKFEAKRARKRHEKIKN